MKNALFLALAMFLATATIAQSVGLRVGANYSDLSIQNLGNEVKTEPRLGYHAGIAVDIPLNKMLSIEPSVLFSTKGSKIASIPGVSSVKFSTHFYYVDIPLRFKLNFGLGEWAKIFVAAGPYAGIGLSGTQDISVTGVSGERDINWGKDYKRFDYGVNAGLGFSIRSLSLEVSYDYGLNDFSMGSVKDSFRKHRIAKLTLGYKIL